MVHSPGFFSKKNIDSCEKWIFGDNGELTYCSRLAMSTSSQEAPVARSFGTHDGSFHADEVSACALLLLFGLIDRDKIVRSRDENRLACCEYVCDVGGVYDPSIKRFDHHQVEYGGEKSSAGLVLQYLRDQQILSKHEWALLQDSVIAGVDAHDNGKCNLEKGICTFSQVISNFSPIEYEATQEQWDRAFFEAMVFAHAHFRRLLERHIYQLGCRERVAAVMAKSQEVLIFEEALPWLDNFFALDGIHHPGLFVIMPSGNFWKLRAIPPSLGERMKVRMPMPSSWAGLMEGELINASGIQGAVFCHKGRFISVWKSKDDARIACEKILKKEAV